MKKRIVYINEVELTPGNYGKLVGYGTTCERVLENMLDYWHDVTDAERAAGLKNEGWGIEIREVECVSYKVVIGYSNPDRISDYAITLVVAGDMGYADALERYLKFINPGVHGLLSTLDCDESVMLIETFEDYSRVVMEHRGLKQ